MTTQLCDDTYFDAEHGFTFHERVKKNYPGNNTTISAGFVDGVDPPCDVIYFRIQKNDGSSRLLCLRADEAQILSWALSGVVWLWITSKEGVL